MGLESCQRRASRVAGFSSAARSCARNAGSEREGRAALQAVQRGTFRFRDALEDDGHGNGPFWIDLALKNDGRSLQFDFTKSSAQAQGGINANRSVVLAACAYAIRCLCPERLPTNDGLFRLFSVVTRPGSLVDPIKPAPVAGGNVETSQRLVDVCLSALGKALRGRIPACSAGTMSNLSMGGIRKDGAEFAFYETLPGGAGAGPNRAGRSAVQTHMTNTRNTPVEETEHRYPVRIQSLTVRRGSGGKGARAGGDGIEKSVETLVPAAVTFLGERQQSGPPGAEGGGAGSKGSITLRSRGKQRKLPSKGTTQLGAGDVVTVRTPGGGGHGRA